MSGGPPVCLVTGGASGIGAACVAAFAAAGYRVALGDVQVNKGKTLAKEHKAFFIRLDVSGESDFATAFNAVQERWGRVDCLVNNAAIAGVLGPIAGIPLEEYEYACAVIQRSVFLGMREAARAMQGRRSGCWPPPICDRTGRARLSTCCSLCCRTPARRMPA